MATVVVFEEDELDLVRRALEGKLQVLDLIGKKLFADKQEHDDEVERVKFALEALDKGETRV